MLLSLGTQTRNGIVSKIKLNFIRNCHNEMIFVTCERDEKNKKEKYLKLKSPYKGHRIVAIVVHPPKHFGVSVRRWIHGIEWIVMSRMSVVVRECMLRILLLLMRTQVISGWSTRCWTSHQTEVFSFDSFFGRSLCWCCRWMNYWWRHGHG